MRNIHDRMPVILATADEDTWLERKRQLERFLAGAAHGFFIWIISRTMAARFSSKS
jgi:putative SOS response-associated peptidase YedK